MIKTVKELKDELNKFDENMNVAICDLTDDGDGEYQTLQPINSLDIETTINDEKILMIVFNAE